MDQSAGVPISVAGVILAAGGATRMGQPKLLLQWKGEALIRHAARTALEAGLDQVVVVTGSGAEDIKSTLLGLNVLLVHNPDWSAGQSTTVRAGVLSLPEHINAVIFLLADQPFVSVDLLQALVNTYRSTKPTILAPFVGDKRTNPVLFDRSVFGAMRGLQGDAGARSIFAQYPPTPMLWPDERLLFDVDTPQDYQKLIS